MKKGILKLLFLAVLYAGLSLFCNPSIFDPPDQTGDGWSTASLADVGMKEESLEDLVIRIEDNTYKNIHSVVIIKDGLLVFEKYFSGYRWAYNEEFQGEYVTWDRDMIHNLASVTKSFTSTLIGIALDHGLMQSVDDKVMIYFPYYELLFNNGKDQINLQHLLTMRAGLEWNEGEVPYSNPNNDLVRLFSVSDPVAYILSKDLIYEPGTVFYYSGGCTNLLGKAIRPASGKRMDDFAQDVLFGPLGITNYEWDFINPNFIHASGNLKLRPRDMAKLGYLFMNGGRWQDTQVVSEDWIEEATIQRVSSSWGGYGYHWWMNTFTYESRSYPSFYAAGWGGQKIYVFPASDLVVVFTGGNYTSSDPTDTMIVSHVLPAL